MTDVRRRPHRDRPRADIFRKITRTAITRTGEAAARSRRVSVPLGPIDTQWTFLSHR